MSLGNSVVLGFCSAFGALVPSIYYNFYPTPGKTTLNDLLTTSWGQIVLAGVIICLLGIYICGKAGMMKEKEMPEEEKKKSVAEFSLVKGLVVAIFSGIMSACFNFGIEAGKPMAEAAVAQGMNPLFQNNVTYVVLLWGGLATNFIWCMILNFTKQNIWGLYERQNTIVDELYAVCTGRHNMVFTVFLLWNGRKQTWERRK